MPGFLILLRLKAPFPQGWEFAHRFSDKLLVFLQKNERTSDSLKKTSDSLIFGSRNWSRVKVGPAPQHCTSLIKKEGMWANRSVLNKNRTKSIQKNIILDTFFSDSIVFCEQKSEWAIRSEKTSNLRIYHERPEWTAHSRSFVMSDLSDSLTVVLLTWATWVIHSQSLIYPEQSERIAHSCSFDLSDLSEWANEFPTLHFQTYIATLKCTITGPIIT